MRTLRTFVLGALVASSLTVASAPVMTSASATTRPVCDLQRDGGEYRRGAFTVTSAVLAQIKTTTFPPHYKRETTVTVRDVDEYRAGAKIGGSLHTTLGNKWINQAEVELHADFEASGMWSTENVTTVTDTIVNNSSQNATFVFFRGSAKKVTAPIRVSSCQNDDGGDPMRGHLYWPRVGTFRTFTVPSDGAVRCGAGTENINSVARKALKVGCA